MISFGETEREATRAKRVLGLVPVLAILTALISIAMLIAWSTMNSVEQREWPHVFLMKANTALALLLLAASLFALWAKGRWFGAASAACACTVIAFSLAVLAQYFVPIDLGIDQWIVVDHATDRFPGRTSIGTALSLLMIATAYLFHTSARTTLIAQGVLLATLVLPIATIGGYLYRAPDLSPFYRASVMSAHSACCTLFLCVGGLFVRPNSGLMRLLLSVSAAGTVARRLLPAAMMLPAAIGAAILYAERVGFFSNALGFATLVASCALFFAAAVWIVTAVMWRTEYAKAQAEWTRDLAELRFREGEQRLRIALEAGRLGTWEFLVDSGQLITSPQCKAIYGLAADAKFDYSDFLSSILPDRSPASPR